MRKSILVVLVVVLLPISSVFAQSQIHIVQQGETLTSIAAHYGVSIDVIVAANKLTDQNAIYVGERLIIPSQTSSSATSSGQSAPGTYTVQSGDTVDGIAAKLGVSPDALIAANHIRDPSLLQVGQVLKIPGATAINAPASGQSNLPDGTQTIWPALAGPPITYVISGGRLTSLILDTNSTGKQTYPLSCESKMAGQIAAMYGLPFDEISFLSSLPRSFNPRRGFVGAVDGRFYFPRDLIGNPLSGPGGYGVQVEGWLPTFEALSRFGASFLASDMGTAGFQIDSALRQGEPVAVWAVIDFQQADAARSVWLGADANGDAVDCGGPAQNCWYLVSGEHTYLIIGRTGNSYLLYNPGNGEIRYYARDAVLIGITAYFAAPTGSAPGAVVLPAQGHIPGLSQLPNWG